MSASPPPWVHVPGAPRVRGIALRTPTLPPATHTNTWVVGEERLTVIDPASPWPDEQAALEEALEQLGRVERIVLTHHHGDHVGGARALQAALPSRPPILAHPETAARVPGVDGHLHEGDLLACDGVELRALHTPGHAPGHLAFHDVASGVIIAGDMVAGVGTILIDPREGDLGTYLASLERLRALAPTALLPAHGPVLPHAEVVLSFYVAHRHQRTEQIRQALVRLGAATPEALAPVVYPELPPEALPVAAVQIRAHLDWMVAHAIARTVDGRWQA